MLRERRSLGSESVQFPHSTVGLAADRSAPLPQTRRLFPLVALPAVGWLAARPRLSSLVSKAALSTSICRPSNVCNAWNTLPCQRYHFSDSRSFRTRGRNSYWSSSLPIVSGSPLAIGFITVQRIVIGKPVQQVFRLGMQ